MKLEPIAVWKGIADKEAADARLAYYLKIGERILNSPNKTYAELGKVLGVTPWCIQMAVQLSGISRPTGRKKGGK
jgi:hypothetical protein